MKLKKLSFLALLGLFAMNAFCQENRLFTLSYQVDKNIPLGLSINKDTELDIFGSKSAISGLAISGDISLYSDSSLVRLILVDHTGCEHLIYETYPILEGSKHFSVAGVAEETSFLDQVIPERVTVELVDASIHLKEILMREGGGAPPASKSERLQQQSLDKIPAFLISHLLYSHSQSIHSGTACPCIQHLLAPGATDHVNHHVE